MTPKNVNLLLENFFKIEVTDHREIQEQARKILRNLGYYVKLEKKIWIGRQGKIDVFAKKGSYSIGIEVEHSTIRKKSIEKFETDNTVFKDNEKLTYPVCP